MAQKKLWYVVAGENFGLVEDAAGTHLVDAACRHFADLDVRGLAIGAVAIDVHRTIYTFTGKPPYSLLPQRKPMVGSPTKQTA